MATQVLFDQLWDFTDPAAGEARFRHALGGADDGAKRLEILTQIARAQGLQGKFDEAHATLDEVERALREHPSDEAFAAARVRLHLERGRVFNFAGSREKALPHFDQAWHAARQARDDHLAIDAAHMIAIVHAAQQRHGEAMAWNQRALDRAESSSQPRARQWRGSLHNNLGWTRHDRGEFSQAMEHFEQALACRIEEGKPREVRLARWCVARCLRSLGRVDEALAVQQALREEWEQAGEKTDGYVHEELGECLLALGRAAEAHSHFAKAHRFLSADLAFVRDQSDRLQRLEQLAKASV